MHFDSFSLDQRILAGIKDAGYVTPTPIQQRAITPVMQGRDLLGLAQTGTGKTAAFVLPLLQRLLDAGAPRRGPVRVLVLAPTRELALQTHESFIQLGRQTGYRSAAVFGGVGQHPQVKALRQASVCVACPGRLLDLLNQGVVDLSRVETLVLDEADRMFDMGFMPDLRKIMARLPAKRQNLLFSATMPKDIRGLADSVLQDPEVVQVANTAPAAGISHALYPVPAHLKNTFLTALLRGTDHGSVLVFTRTKHRAKTLARKLDQQGWPTASLQGNLSQNRRQEALDGFRRGKYRILVATDIAARGIDCEGITHVINFDVPDTAESYTHRIGRTGRAQRSGEAMTLVTDQDRSQMRAIERALGKDIKRCQLDGFDYGAAGQPQGKRPAPAGRPRGPKTSGPGGGKPRNAAPQGRGHSRKPSRQQRSEAR